nr:NAD(P)-dependent alcohol dehydrogenase [Pyrinomonadaceae bacterium]
MKSIEIQNSFGIDSLNQVERTEPTPGPGQVVVRVRAASLNYRDLMVVKGSYNPKQKLPLIPLSDGAGEVVATGLEATRVRAGERVAGTFFQEWTEGELTDQKARSSLGSPIDGMLAEYVVLNEDGVVHMPEHLTYEEAATLPCAAVTAWHALLTKGNLKAGETVLVQG